MTKRHKTSKEVRDFLRRIGAKGGRVLSPAKRDQLRAASASAVEKRRLRKLQLT